MAGNGNQNQLPAVVVASGLVLARDGRTVVEACDLEIGAGVTSLVGPNGSGKSTLLHAVAGLLAPAAGSVARLRRSARRGAPAHRLRAAGAAHPDPPPGHRPRGRRTGPRPGARRRSAGLRATDRAAVQDAIDRVELGPLAGRHLSELSGGERQRAFVAQGLAQDGDLLLLDEPTAGLDAASTERIRRVLADERAAGRSVIVATHDLEDAAGSDHVVLLAGRVVAAGAPAEALAREHLQEAYRGRLLDVAGDAVLVDDDAHHHHHG